MFFAGLDLVYGYSLANPTAGTLTSPTNRFFASVLPLPAWACVWITVGLICLWHAFHRYDRFGFSAAVLIKMLWGILALVGVITAGVSPSVPAIWLALAGLVWVLSGWREPHQDADDAEGVPDAK